jgi:hypothetical protein
VLVGSVETVAQHDAVLVVVNVLVLVVIIIFVVAVVTAMNCLEPLDSLLAHQCRWIWGDLGRDSGRHGRWRFREERRREGVGARRGRFAVSHGGEEKAWLSENLEVREKNEKTAEARRESRG